MRKTAREKDPSTFHPEESSGALCGEDGKLMVKHTLDGEQWQGGKRRNAAGNDGGMKERRRKGNGEGDGKSKNKKKERKGKEDTKKEGRQQRCGFWEVVQDREQAAYRKKKEERKERKGQEGSEKKK